MVVVQKQVKPTGYSFHKIACSRYDVLSDDLDWPSLIYEMLTLPILNNDKLL